MALAFNDENFKQMARVENHVASVLAPYRANTEAALVVLALMRCARILLKLYPLEVKAVLVGLCCDYLQERADPSTGGSFLER